MTGESVAGLVSVVVASYNHARYLPRRMESLINQTYPNLEILVIDDHSPDNSVEVLRRYADHPRVQLIEREQNGGWVAVSNQGLAMARGQYVLFANCDDDCEVNMIAALVDALQRSPSAVIAFCRSVLIDQDGIRLGDDYEIREPAFKHACKANTLIAGRQMARFLMHSCVIPNLSAALFCKKALLAESGFSQAYRVCCDWDLFFRLTCQYDVAYVAAPLNLFRQHAATIRSTTRERDVYAEYFRLLLGVGRSHPAIRGVGRRVELRYMVMKLWCVHLLSRRGLSLTHFVYHWRYIAALDPAALLLLPAAFVFRSLELISKYVRTFSSNAHTPS